MILSDQGFGLTRDFGVDHTFDIPGAPAWSPDGSDLRMVDTIRPNGPDHLEPGALSRS